MFVLNYSIMELFVLYINKLSRIPTVFCFCINAQEFSHPCAVNISNKCIQLVKAKNSTSQMSICLDSWLFAGWDGDWTWIGFEKTKWDRCQIWAAPPNVTYQRSAKTLCALCRCIWVSKYVELSLSQNRYQSDSSWFLAIEEFPSVIFTTCQVLNGFAHDWTTCSESLTHQWSVVRSRSWSWSWRRRRCPGCWDCWACWGCPPDSPELDPVQRRTSSCPAAVRWCRSWARPEPR